MIILIAAGIGATIGALSAKRRKGRLADILQYGVVYALAFAILGLFATLLIDRAIR